MLALLFQILVVQTHVHRGGPATAGAAATTASAPSRAPHEAPACPLCQEQAQAGHWLPPAPPLLPAMVAGAAITALVTLSAVAAIDRPRGWRNRGPPAPTADR